MKKIFILIAAATLLFPLITNAAEFRAEKNGSITIGGNERPRNLYTAGSNVTVNSPVGGDLVVAGGTVNINGNVEQSLLSAGGNVTLSSNVGQNARIAGGSITINYSDIGQDLLSTGGTFVLNENSTVGGDLVTSSGSDEINGRVGGTLRSATGTLIIDGEINGDVIAKVNQLEVRDGAIIRGNVRYTSSNEANIAQGAQISGSVERTDAPAKETKKAEGLLATAKILDLIGSLLLLLLLVYLFPRLSARLVNEAFQSWSSFFARFGLGLAIFIVAPIIIVIIGATIVGLRIALIALLLHLLLLALASPFGVILLGTAILKIFRRNQVFELNWLVALIGLLAATILGLIPGLGWLVLAIFYLTALGGLALLLFNWFSRQREEAK